MAYADLVDVLALDTGRATYSPNTKPTASQVGEHLENTAAEIDGILRSRGYTVPVPTTATGTRQLVDMYNAMGAAALVQAGAQNAPKAAQALAMWENAKKMLMELEFDAPKSSEQILRSGVVASAVYDMDALATTGVF